MFNYWFWRCVTELCKEKFQYWCISEFDSGVQTLTKFGKAYLFVKSHIFSWPRCVFDMLMRYMVNTSHLGLLVIPMGSQDRDREIKVNFFYLYLPPGFVQICIYISMYPIMYSHQKLLAKWTLQNGKD